MSDRPTPMTDDAVEVIYDHHEEAWRYFVPADFARTLERQLAEAKDALETIVKVASRHDWIGPVGEMDAALAACRRLIEAKEVEP